MTSTGFGIQDWFDDVKLRSRKGLETKLNYIHENPLQEQWNLVDSPEKYPSSSAAFYENAIPSELEIIHYLRIFLNSK
jgi:putative transposase